MKMSAAFPGKYIKASDLQGKAVLVTIANVKLEEIKNQDGTSVTKPVLHFAGKEMGLVLNLTNSQTISQYYGDESDLWPGKPLEVFPSTTQFGSKVVDCIRVRVPVAETAPVQPVAAPVGAPQTPAAGGFTEQNPPPVQSEGDYGAELSDDIPF